MKKETKPYFYAGQKQTEFCSTVKAGNLVWASGMSGRLPKTGQVGTPDPAQQVRDALDKIKHNLEEAGTSLDNVVKWNWYIKDTCRDRTAIEQAIVDYLIKNSPALAEDMPAAVWVGVRELYYPNMLIELGDITAIMPNTEKIKTYPYLYAGKKQAEFCSTKIVGNLVWAAGMSGRLPKTGQVGTPDPGQQVRDALDKIKHNLEEAGTSLENIVRMNIYVKDTNRDREQLEAAWGDYLKKNAPDLLENPPAATWVGVRELYYPNMLVEFEAMALLPD
ncbi:RidA family protein [Chloroflexota bacterium]